MVCHSVSQVARTVLKIHTANSVTVKMNILHGAVSWAKWIQSTTPSHSASLRFILSSFHLCLPGGLSPADFIIKILMFHILPMHAISPVHLNLDLIIFGEADRLWLYTSVQWGSVLHLCPLWARCFLVFSLCLIRQSYPTVCESSHGKSTLPTLHNNSCWKLYPPTKPHISQWYKWCDTFCSLHCI